MNTAPPDSGPRPSQDHYSSQELKSFDEARLHQCDDNPLLNYQGLVEACNAIYEGRTSLPHAEYNNKLAQAYRIDMIEYAQRRNFSDALKLVQFLAFTRARIMDLFPLPDSRTNALFIPGVGQGRLMEVLIPLAKLLGFKRITLNDLIDDHVQMTQQRVKDIFGSGQQVSGVDIDYVTGDFLEIDIPRESYDTAILWWYTSSEIFDPSSKANLWKSRISMRAKFNDILIPRGALIDQTPDVDMAPSLHNLLVYKTRHILQQKGILPGINGLMLNNWQHEQTQGFPYQIRFAPGNGTAQKELQDAGFELRRKDSVPTPIQVIGPARDTALIFETIKRLEDPSALWTALGDLEQTRIAHSLYPPGHAPDQEMSAVQWYEKVD